MSISSITFSNYSTAIATTGTLINDNAMGFATVTGTDLDFDTLEGVQVHNA